MHRSTIAALVTAAVIGVSGGVAAASMNGARKAPPSSTPSTQPSTVATPSTTPQTPTPSGTASTVKPLTGTEEAAPNVPLLYFSPDRIHDGDKVIAFPHATRVNALARTATGYLLSEPTSSQAAEFDLWAVTSTGRSNRIASVTGFWDLNVRGDRVVGTDLQTGRITIWDLRTGAPVATWKGTTDATGDPVFAGDQVLISQLTDSGSYALERWDPATGVTRESGQGYEYPSASPGGSYLAGAVDSSGGNGKINSCLALTSTYLTKRQLGWRTCDWGSYGGPVRFSPDGTRLVAAPAETDGFGPGEFGIIDASDGPRSLVATFRTPDWTLGAEWADNDHLYVYGARNGDPDGGTVIRRCDFAGQCTVLVSSKQHLTVAGVY